MVARPSPKWVKTCPEMVWVQRGRFIGWACPECAWEFNPSDVLTGSTLAEIKQQYEDMRDKEFQAHVCAEYPKSSEGPSCDEQCKPTQRPRSSQDRKWGNESALASPGTKPNWLKLAARKAPSSPTLPRLKNCPVLYCQTRFASVHSWLPSPYNRIVGGVMSCPSCVSGTQAEFPAEMLIHLSGLKDVDHPGVFVFQKVLICTDCGFSQFEVPANELASLSRRHSGTSANTPSNSRKSSVAAGAQTTS